MTSAINFSGSTTPGDLMKALGAMQAIGVRKDWMLVSPDGRVWVTDDVTKLFMVLAPHHPLLKITT
jgi:hypothetical protein